MFEGRAEIIERVTIFPLWPLCPMVSIVVKLLGFGFV
jgi:hypothetical protein